MNIELNFTLPKLGAKRESTVCRIIQKVETLLIQSGEFRLPGKKQLYQNAYEWNVVLIDVAETPIERPKKSRNLITVARKSGIL